MPDPSTTPRQPEREHPASERLVRPRGITALAVLQFVVATWLLLASAAIAAQHIGIAAVGVLPLLLHVVCGVGLWYLDRYGRVLQILLAIAYGLLAFPIAVVTDADLLIPVGVGAGGLILAYMLSKRVKLLFSGATPSQLASHELELLRTPSYLGVAVTVLTAVLVVSIPVITIATLHRGIQMGKWKRSQVGLLNLGKALEGFRNDKGFVPVADSVARLEPFLMPTYISSVATRDHWLNELRYLSWGHVLHHPDGAGNYALVSSGADGLFEETELDCEKWIQTQSLDCDIVYCNGGFVQFLAYGAALVDGCDLSQNRESARTNREP